MDTEETKPTITPEELDQRIQGVVELIHLHRWKDAAKELSDWEPPEIAEVMFHLDKSDRVLLFRSIPRPKAADVFSYLDYEHQDALLTELTDEDTRHLLANLTPDDRTALLEELPAKVLQRMMMLLSPSDLREARQLLGYPEESVGRLMTPDYIRVKKDMTVAEALAHMRRYGRDRETFNLVYVTDDEGKLLDALRLRRFIMASPDDKVESLMDYDFIAMNAFEDREKAVEMVQLYDLNALPVVDSQGVLLGIVTVDDIMDVAEEEATEDIHKIGAVAPLETPYSLASPFMLVRKRIGWLLALVFVNLISSGVIAAYEATLETYLVLAFFIPLLIGSGGNSGAQSATLVVRALATGDLRTRSWLPTLAKEVFVGLMLGAMMGLVSSVLGAFRGDWTIGLVIGLAMTCIILVANLMGSMLPFLLTKLKLDPAVASSPLITTTVDVVGLMIYFGVATLILQTLG
ncbi:MAG: magnesium transporter [Puniceicoccaceae bacterium]|nr:MAG: magnesium transporter [Puniceicoccaceae bacterium]